MEIRIVIDDRLIDVVRRVGARMTRRRVAAAAALGVLGTAAAALAVDKPHDFSAGTPARAVEVNQNFDVLYEAFNTRVVREDQTIVVDDCAHLLDTLDALDEVRIAARATLTLEIQAGTSTCPRPVVMEHPTSSRILIRGVDPEQVGLELAAGESGFVARSGHLRVENLTVRTDEYGSWAAGLLAEPGATLSARDVRVEGFTYGAAARGGTMVAEGVAASGCYTAFSAVDGGTLRALGTVAESGYHGYYAESGTISATNSSAEGFVNGYLAIYGGTLVTHGLTMATGNGAAFMAGSHATVQTGQIVVARWNGDVFHAVLGGYVIMPSPDSLTLEGNVQVTTMPLDDRKGYISQ